MSSTRAPSSRVDALRNALTDATTSSQSLLLLLLKNVSIPIAVLPQQIAAQQEDDFKTTTRNLVSEEGLVLCHVWIQNGKVERVCTHDCGSDGAEIEKISSSATVVVVDCQRSVLMPCFVDCHVHLDKTMTNSRTRNMSGTVEEAWLQKEPHDWKYWTTIGGDLTRRMDFAVRCAIHYGTKAMRTHLDGYNCGDDHDLEERLRTAVYEAYTIVKERYQDQLELQAVANLYLPLYFTLPDLARAHCMRAKQVPGAVLGAYIGNTADMPESDTAQHFDAMLALAKEFDMDIDLHIDETNDRRCCALKPLVKSLSKARKNGYEGIVVLGHCCALSLQDDETKTFICQQLAELGNVLVVANPFTNVSLQDRRGTKPPLGAKVPVDPARTPQWRGLTLVQELREAGVAVATASDNVRDFWLSAGSDYDMLSVWSNTQALCHLDTAPNEGSWADVVTWNPARAMGLLEDHLSPLDVDQPADFILFPGARNVSELFSRAHNNRIVMRTGKVQNMPLPDYAELDDLMDNGVNDSSNPDSINFPKGETEILLGLLGLEDYDDTATIESHPFQYTRIPHFEQLETWDCGPSCLMMALKWLNSNSATNETDDAVLQSSILTPGDMQERRQILQSVATQSLWTPDLMMQLQQWKTNGGKPLIFVLVSNNIVSADQVYESFEYYQQAYPDDQIRVSVTFQELRRQCVPMIETMKLPFSVLMTLVSRHDDVVCLLLLDNNVLRRKQTMEDCAPGDDENLASYAGHYVIVCGTSNDPHHTLEASIIRPHDILDLCANASHSDFCCVLANPDPSSPTPYQFVMPDHLEAAWRSKGTDDDVIFLRKSS